MVSTKIKRKKKIKELPAAFHSSSFCAVCFYFFHILQGQMKQNLLWIIQVTCNIKWCSFEWNKVNVLCGVDKEKKGVSKCSCLGECLHARVVLCNCYSCICEHPNMWITHKIKANRQLIWRIDAEVYTSITSQSLSFMIRSLNLSFSPFQLVNYPGQLQVNLQDPFHFKDKRPHLQTFLWQKVTYSQHYL